RPPLMSSFAAQATLKLDIFILDELVPLALGLGLEFFQGQRLVGRDILALRTLVRRGEGGNTVNIVLKICISRCPRYRSYSGIPHILYSPVAQLLQSICVNRPYFHFSFSQIYRKILNRQGMYAHTYCTNVH